MCEISKFIRQNGLSQTFLHRRVNNSLFHVKNGTFFYFLFQNELEKVVFNQKKFVNSYIHDVRYRFVNERCHLEIVFENRLFHILGWLLTNTGECRGGFSTYRNVKRPEEP